MTTAHSSDAILDRTRGLIQRGQYQAATLLLPALAALGPDLPWQAEIEAELAYAQGQFAKTMTITQASLERWPHAARLHEARSKAASASGDRVTACLAAADAVINDPQSLHAKALLGRTLLALGKYDQATLCLREVLDSAPDDWQVRQLMTHAAPGDAIALLREGIKIDGTNIEARNALIRCLLDQQNPTAAADEADAAINLGIADTTTRFFAIEAAGCAQNWSKAAILCADVANEMGLAG